MGQTERFEAERPRLRGLAAKILADPAEAEDIVQLAWLRLERTTAEVEDLPAWLTTVTSRLCLDRLRARTPVPTDEVDQGERTSDPETDLLLADAVGAALHVVVDRLSPRERVAFVLHDSFGFEFDSIARILDCSASSARKLASRARAKVREPSPIGSRAEAVVVDAFLAAARNGDFERLVRLLAPDAVIAGDEAAIEAGTPAIISGRHEVATFFNGAASAALPAYVGGSPGAAWFHRGQARVAFDFTVVDAVVRRIDFRADPSVLSAITPRPVTSQHHRSSDP